MSYMLEFPPAPLPPNIRSGPYVAFGIGGQDVCGRLPDKIPLAMVLHFCPKMKDFLIPDPPSLSQEATYLTLYQPYVPIDLPSKISIIGLSWIVSRMMQLIGLPLPRSNFNLHNGTGVETICHILWTWHFLELPSVGSIALKMHLMTSMMVGPAISLENIKAIWYTFDRETDIVLTMVRNFVNAYLNQDYTHLEGEAIRKFINGDPERKRFFEEIAARMKATAKPRGPVTTTVPDINVLPEGTQAMGAPSTSSYSTESVDKHSSEYNPSPEPLQLQADRSSEQSS